MLGFISLAWPYLRKFKATMQRNDSSEKQVETVMRTSAVKTRRWQRFPVSTTRPRTGFFIWRSQLKERAISGSMCL
jgi:hypothetical protein